MKAVKILVGLIVVVALAVVVLMFVSPTHTHVERSVVVDAPIDYVWEHTNTLADMNSWSPWLTKDPNMKEEYKGAEDGMPGAIHYWNGNEDVGEGEQEIVSTDNYTMTTELRFMKPWESTSDASVILSEEDGKTRVTWTFDSDSPMPMNVMNTFVDMDKMLGGDFETGLSNLNEMVAANKAARKEFDGFTIEKHEMPATTFVGLRDTVSFTDMGAYFESSYGKIQKMLAKAKVQPTGMPGGLYFTWDEANGESEMMAAFPVPAGTTIEGLETFEVKGSTLMIDYFGSYEESGKAHNAMETYMKWHNVQMGGPAIEIYANDPSTVSDPSEINTKIYYPVAG